MKTEKNKKQRKKPLAKLSRKKKILLAAFTVETAKIERQTLTNSISATGTVESAQTKTVNTSLKDIEIVAVHVKKGDYVEKGTVICEFDSTDYEEALANARHNKSVNAQIEALNGDYTTIYNEAVADAEEGFQNVRDDRNEARDAYNAAAENLEQKAEELAKAKAAYDSIADELAATPPVLEQYKKDYEAAQTKLAEAQVELSFAEESGDASAIEHAKQLIKSAEASVETTKNTYDTASTRYEELCTIESSYKNAQSQYTDAQKNNESTLSAYEQAQAKREDYQSTYEAALEKAKDTYDKAALEA